MNAPFKKLLVPVDGSEVSEHAVRQGIALARQMGASICGFVVEALPALPDIGTHLPSYRQTVAAHEARTESHAHAVLAHFAAAAGAAGVPFEGHYERNDDVAASIAAAAADRGCDMIVMATHGRGPFGAMLLGSQTRRVMALSRVPLLVLH